MAVPGAVFLISLAHGVGLITHSQDWLLAGVSSLVPTTTATHSLLAPGQGLTLYHQGGGFTQLGHLRQERDELF